MALSDVLGWALGFAYVTFAVYLGFLVSKELLGIEIDFLLYFIMVFINATFVNGAKWIIQRKTK
jgi:hypothetical protein